MLVLIGPTCSGKDTIANEIKQLGFTRALEVTTREPRDYEKNGVDYWFVSQEQFDTMINNGELVAVMEFERIQHGQCEKVYYATRKIDVDRADDKIILTTNAGAMKKLKAYSDKVWTAKLTIRPEVQAKRLKLRGDNPEEIKKRIKTDSEALKDVVTDYELDNSDTCIWLTAHSILGAYETRNN